MIPGNSGCKLEFKEDTVVKYGGERLEIQMELQLGHDHPLVKAPHVLNSFWLGDGFTFEMEYIRGATTIFKSPDICLTKVCRFVLDNLEQSCYHSLPAQLFIDKINSIPGVHEFPEAAWLCERFVNGVTIPIGPMHGDLTFCNVLCRGEDVWLIDFLDGFVTSPVFDVAKMRQDSYHGWIETFDDAPSREYVDTCIMNVFGHLPCLREFQLLNLLRIVPYARDDRVTNFLRREIPRAFADLD